MTIDSAPVASNPDKLVSDGVEEAGIEAIRERMAEVIQRHLGGATSAATPLAGLTIHGRTAPIEPASFLYAPSFAFIARGSKRVLLGEREYQYDQSHFLLTAVNLPTIVQVVGATPKTPYLSMKLDFDLDLAREVITDVDLLGRRGAGANTGLAIGRVNLPLAASTMRLVELLDSPDDLPILGRSIQREVLYRILVTPLGERLRQAVQLGSQTHRVTAAIRWIRENVHEPLRISKLADIAGMAESTLHHHFRALTAMTPVRYQKHLRLHEARQLMINERIAAGSAAHRVGYESATQFSREYRRFFGRPPKQDVSAIVTTVEDRAAR